MAYALGFMTAASAAEIDFSYNLNNLPTHGFGYDKAETYDVAIRIDEPSLNGTLIKGITVSIPGGDAISGCAGWLTNELTLKRVNGKYVNEPDIMISEGTLTGGVLTVTFDEPYAMEGPVYAGYSFTVGQLADGSGAPVMVAEGADADGLYLHSSRTKLKWSDCSVAAGGVSEMKVLIEGDFRENAASFAMPGELKCSAENENPAFTVDLVNHGLNAVSGVTYEYSVAGLSKKCSITLADPLPANWGARAAVTLEPGHLEEAGEYELVMRVTEVNGKVNSDAGAEVAVPLRVYAFLPVNRPLVEEYTGLWCGFCPRGYVALETMREEYPDRFVGVAYHSGDDMQYDGEWPASPGSYPDGYINRTKASLGDIYTVWPNYAGTSTPAEINVDVQWTDDTHSMLRATSSTRFMEDAEKANFGVGYMLLADGLSNPDWAQSNYYAPKEGEEPKDNPDMPGKWGELFTHGTDPMKGLVFNDVIIDGKYIVDGFPGSIPAQITANEEIRHNCVFNLDELGSPDLVQDKNKLRVVAVLIDRKKGKPVNCNTSLYPDGTGSEVDAVMEDAGIVSTEWFTLQGIRISSPASGMGILIRVDHLDDGSVNSSRQLF